MLEHYSWRTVNAVISVCNEYDRVMNDRDVRRDSRMEMGGASPDLIEQAKEGRMVELGDDNAAYERIKQIALDM